MSGPRVHLFNERILPHLDSAYNLSRWLVRKDGFAEDAVQEACLRAFKYLDALKDQPAKPWFLQIVRNTCFSMLRLQHSRAEIPLDEEILPLDEDEDRRSDPMSQLASRQQRSQIDVALRRLSPVLREVIVLRELEELEYAQIASIIDAPIGTVMSRLHRARTRLRELLRQADQGAVQ